MSATEDLGWRVQSVRMTAFTVGDVDSVGWWQVATGEAPETELFKPKEGLRQYSGPFTYGGDADAVLHLAHAGERVDWIVRPTILHDAITPGLATLGEPADVWGPFVELASRWLDTAPELNRLAFGSVVVRSLASLDAGHALLAERYLPFDFRTKGASDFAYQINRPRTVEPSEAGTALVNRLSKWSVAALESMRIGQEMSLGTTSHYAAMLEMDINTPPEIPLPYPSRTLALLQALATEISSEGDRP